MPPKTSERRYELKYGGSQAIEGLHIPSHTPSFSYYKLDNIPTDPVSSAQQYQRFRDLLQQQFLGGQGENPGREIKRSLISLAVFAGPTEYVVGNPDFRALIDGFQDKLRILLPRSLGFRKILIDSSDIVFETDTGRFSLDAVSGGVGAIVGIAWQVYMYGLGKQSMVVTIDEPETHLHPSMQRELLPNLTKAFPTTQFVIATHSPFIVTSAPDARVYALVYNDQRRVISVALQEADLSGTANETLREILGVPLSVPIWVENRLDEIARKYTQLPMTAENLARLRDELRGAGLGALLPEALDVVEKDHAQDT
jgi:hypothetical protein